MGQYRKKPVVIEAVTWDGKYASPGEWPDWFNEAMNAMHIYPTVGSALPFEGELYPCKPDIFEATYEAVK